MNRLIRSASHFDAFRAIFVRVAQVRRGRMGGPIQSPLRSDRYLIPPFFIIGSGRSGNTLLRAMLDVHPTLGIPPESYVLGRVSWIGQVYRHDPWPRQVERILQLFESSEFRNTWSLDLGAVYSRMIDVEDAQRGIDALVDAVFRAHLEAVGAEFVRWGDKTPLNALYLPWINDLFPDAQYIHMLRDGRDVAVSYVRAGLYDSLEESTDRWIESVRHARRLSRRVPRNRFLEVRYENLVSSPWEEVARVAQFLGIEPRADMREYWRNGRELGDTGRPHHENVGRPVNTDSIGRWKTLTVSEQQKLGKLLGPILEIVGYD